MFARSNEGIWQSSLLLGIPGVLHGFASRHSGTWPGEYTGVRQIHSSLVIEAGSHPPPQADALVTSDPGRWVGIRTADCVPVLIAHRTGAAVAAVHAGWRGTAAEISARAVGELRDRYGLRSSDFIAALGPCIGPCCFAVGPEVERQFQWLPVPARRPGYVNLAEANRRQLESAGIPAGQIDVSELCTMCRAEEFHSYRRDRDHAGRMVAAISIRRA